ncbi:hypothetical protein Cs7R123_37810 [Catellatospora sp. TT07R-123]|nr:hypothetical protein Cs7R123_37810 [Catellatospora sp. TT07R-123]
MSRVVAGILLGAVTLLAASACTPELPKHIDGNLTNGWPAMAEPKGWEPKADMCMKAFHDSLSRSMYEPVECDRGHSYETVGIGEFTGEAANAEKAPAAGSAALKAAWSDCDKKATAFVGADWRGGMLWMGVSVPGSVSWTSGSRWYLCQIAALDRSYGDPSLRSISLKDELTKNSPLKYGCYQYGSSMVAIDCKKAHNSEYAGIWNAPANMTYARLPKADDTIAGECRKVIAKYVKVPADGNMKYRTGVAWDWPSEADWDAGDHGVRCHIWLDKKKVTRSLKGTGNSGLPINYA